MKTLINSINVNVVYAFLVMTAAIQIEYAYEVMAVWLMIASLWSATMLVIVMAGLFQTVVSTDPAEIRFHATTALIDMVAMIVLFSGEWWYLGFIFGTIYFTTLGVLLVSIMAYFGYEDLMLDMELDQIHEDQFECLAKNVYFESRNQSDIGKRAVAWVTLNRVNSDKYPNTICDVVWQDRQFSWTHDGKSDDVPPNVVEQAAWERSVAVSEDVMADYISGGYDPTEGATMFHADYVTPYWTDSFDRVAQIDSHIFYK